MAVGKVLLLVLSVSLFGVSLTQSAFYTAGATEGTDSLPLLVWGWMGFFAGEIGSLIWLANPLLGLCWALLFAAPRVSLFMSIVCVFTMLAFLLLGQMPVNENGKYELIVRYGAGYWLWVSSAAILVVGNSGLILYGILSVKRSWSGHFKSPAR